MVRKNSHAEKGCHGPNDGSIFFEHDPDLHAMCMSCMDTYREQFLAATAGQRPLTDDDKRWFRKLNNEPEPFPDELQERFLQTLASNKKFCSAVRNLIRGAA